MGMGPVTTEQMLQLLREIRDLLELQQQRIMLLQRQLRQGFNSLGVRVDSEDDGGIWRE